MATPEHPLYQTNQGWTLASSLRKGMGLLLATGLSLSIDSVAAIDTTCTVYNCDVPLTHTYYVGNNGLLAHNANVCNKLVVAVLNKLGAGYDAAGVKTALETIFEKYALKFSGATSAIKEEQAIAELSKLCSQSISKTNLENLLKYIGTDAAKASTFANDLEKYALLDDFAKDGRLLDFYVAIKTNNFEFANFASILDTEIKSFKSFYSFASNEGLVKVIGGGMVKEFIQAKKLGQELGATEALFYANNPGIEGLMSINNAKTPFSLKYFIANDMKSIKSKIIENAKKIREQYEKLGGNTYIKQYCKFDASANTYLRVDVPNITKQQVINQFNTYGYVESFGTLGTFKQIRIVTKDGDVLFNSQTIIN